MRLILDSRSLFCFFLWLLSLSEFWRWMLSWCCATWCCTTVSPSQKLTLNFWFRLLLADKLAGFSSRLLSWLLPSLTEVVVWLFSSPKLFTSESRVLASFKWDVRISFWSVVFIILTAQTWVYWIWFGLKDVLCGVVKLV